MSQSKPVAAVVVPVGPGITSALDTLESVASFCPEPNCVVVVDDHTEDGTYQALLSHKRENWYILRNERRMGRDRLVHTLCYGFRFVVSQWNCPLVLRLDQDALIIKAGVISDALEYMRARPHVGLFGVYECDYDRPRSFDSHRTLIARETNWLKKFVGLEPSWSGLLTTAESRGYSRGDNVFGGAYFITGDCLRLLNYMGALNVPYRWHSRLMEDVYFSMATVAAGFNLGHFAAPDGPLCLEWNGLPYPAKSLIESHYKIVHSVDKGKNTNRDANDGKSAREYFKIARHALANPLNSIESPL